MVQFSGVVIRFQRNLRRTWLINGLPKKTSEPQGLKLTSFVNFNGAAGSRTLSKPVYVTSNQF